MLTTSGFSAGQRPWLKRQKLLSHNGCPNGSSWKFRRKKRGLSTSKGDKHVVNSHISDKHLTTKRKALIEQVKQIKQPRPNNGQLEKIWHYNKMVMGMQNYYRIATHISLDASKLTPSERSRYGKSAMLRYLADEPIYPIGYVQFKIPKSKSNSVPSEMTGEFKLKLLKQSLNGRSIEYVDNRISLYAAQKGQCAVTGEKFTSTDEIHCHHKIPKSQGGTDEYQNLILVTATVHKLIHAINADTIQQYLQACKPNFKKLNVLRQIVGNTILSVD